ILINGFHTPQGDKNARQQVRGIPQVLWDQLLLELLLVVLHRRRCLRLPPVSHLRAKSLEVNIFIRLQPNVCWHRDDLLAPRQPLPPLRRRPLLGCNVAAHEQVGGEVVLSQGRLPAA
uniref:Uncharacterized protein n=1 Tax=Triticum urartu TaxID=4572 RepID=A0A8R7U3Q1_TRIUA